MLHRSVLEAIGHTPLIPLSNLRSQIPCSFYVKCEFLNPGGSVKDRIAKAMIEEAEASGRIKPGDTLIEPTSGNTGIGIALAAAVKGYNVIITMPEKMSQEKQVILEALGARIIRTPNHVAFDHPESHISVAKKLCSELPRAHILDQYANEANPEIHANTTAREILADINDFDMIVIGAGTGGTLTGCARTIRKALPRCQIVGVDPVGSLLSGDYPITPYSVEGIGYDFIPKVLERKLVDRWIRVDDNQSFLWARRLIRKEGLLVGGSAGAAMAGAVLAAAELPSTAKCVVLLPDGVRNYMSKFLRPAWLEEHGFTVEHSNEPR